MVHELGLLKHFIPELEQSIGVKQPQAHAYEVWEHLFDPFSTPLTRIGRWKYVLPPCFMMFLSQKPLAFHLKHIK